ncbi:MAG: hypothetical protein KDB07_06190 [Planctomycetes bacterium]|nr:hypothetical protein [Planctomycetota bacterium]
MQAYIDKSFRQASLERIEQCNEIIEAYQELGLRLTLRQLYYQFVARDLIPNNDKEYKNLGSLVSDGRMAGLIPWDAIEDRIRVPQEPPEWPSIDDLAELALESFRLPRLQGQPIYPELWVEKDALSGVLAPIARQHHITMMVNRGYSSQSAMRESALRIQSNMKSLGSEQAVVLYLGDMDPSGLDMIRDVQERLQLFGCDALSVRHVALTSDQVAEYDPPPNPAKIKDPRAKAYISQYGSTSWEVDALDPTTLRSLIEQELVELLDQSLISEILAEEWRQKERLKRSLRKPT